MSGIAIVGAGGFVGQSLVESLVLDGHVGVRAIVRNYRNMAGLCRFGSAIDIRRADAEDSSSLNDAIAGSQTVINLTTGPPAGIVRSTRALFEACSKAGVQRFIHLSSAVVYGDVLKPTADDDPPVSKHWMPYARAKAVSEVWLRERMNTGNVDVVVLRPGIVWGVRSPHTLDIALSLAAKRACLVASGTGVFNGIFIANLVDSIRTCCDHRARASGFYNVGDGESVTWRDFFESLGPPLGCDPSRLPIVEAQVFPRSLGSTIDGVLSLPLMNNLYHRAKVHVPDGVKTAIRGRLEGRYGYDRHASTYLAGATINREMWHLQSVRHKLPIDKFVKTFGVAPSVSFRDGVRRTVSWLDSLGLVSTACPVLRD